MTTRLPVMPIPGPCTHYEGHVRCTAMATHYLIDPDGKLNPGGRVCLPHGQSYVTEYREKLRENWSLVDIPRGNEPEGSLFLEPPAGGNQAPAIGARWHLIKIEDGRPWLVVTLSQMAAELLKTCGVPVHSNRLRGPHPSMPKLDLGHLIGTRVKLPRKALEMLGVG